MERLQQDNTALRRSKLEPSLEDEADKLMNFSDEMDKRQDEVNDIRRQLVEAQAETARMKAENKRLEEKGRGSGPPHGVVAVAADRVSVANERLEREEEEVPAQATDAAHAEVMKLRRANNKLRFELSEMQERNKALQQQLDQRGPAAPAADDAPPHTQFPTGGDAWGSFGSQAGPRMDAHSDPFGGRARTMSNHAQNGLGNASVDSRADDPLEPDPVSTREHSGGREIGMWSGRNSADATQPDAAQPRDLAQLFQSIKGADQGGAVGVYIIRRQVINIEGRTKGKFITYTVTDKESGDFVMVAVTQTELLKGLPVTRLFSEDVKRLCHEGTSPDGTHRETPAPTKPFATPIIFISRTFHRNHGWVFACCSGLHWQACAEDGSAWQDFQPLQVLTRRP